MKRLILCVCVILICAGGSFAQSPGGDAALIVRNSRDRIKADTVFTQSRMTITAKDGTVSEREMEQYSKDGPKGNRAVIVFLRPAGVAGTRFLTVENPGAADDRWILLPPLKNARRILASGGSGSFLGTDFSYDDISSADRNVELDNHSLLREENYNGNLCYVVESVPKDSSYQYSKMVQWIDKASRINYKIDLYDKRGTLVKVLEILGFKEVQGRLSPMVTRMKTLETNTFTTINVETLKYDENIPEGFFTIRFLETGRPR
jgi:hypothetical protein